jgi:hypothetical protein
VELVVVWRVVAEKEASNSQDVNNSAHDITPAPLQRRVEVQVPSNRRTKYGERNRGTEDERVPRTTLFVGNQFANHDGKGELSSTSKAIDGVHANESVDVLCGGANDVANQRKNGAQNEQPPAAKDWVLVRTRCSTLPFC